jgi:hypothetical protein
MNILNFVRNYSEGFWGHGSDFPLSAIIVSVATVRSSSGTAAKYPHCRTLSLMDQFYYTNTGLPWRVDGCSGDEELTPELITYFVLIESLTPFSLISKIKPINFCRYDNHSP